MIYKYFDNFDKITFPNGDAYAKIMKVINTPLLITILNNFVGYNYEIQNQEKTFYDISYNLYQTDEYFWILMIMNRKIRVDDIYLNDQRIMDTIEKNRKLIIEFPLDTDLYDPNMTINIYSNNIAFKVDEVNFRIECDIDPNNINLSDIFINTSLTLPTPIIYSKLNMPKYYKINNTLINNRKVANDYVTDDVITVFDDIQNKNINNMKILALTKSDMENFVSRLDSIIQG